MKDIMETITSDVIVEYSGNLARKGESLERLKGSGPYTLFAPNDAPLSG